MRGIRLLPVLLFGLVSLLSIKLLSMAMNAPAYPPPGAGPSAFERAIKIAREGPQENELITGSVDKKDEKKDETTKKDGADAPASDEAIAKARAELRAKAEPEGVRIPPPNGSAAAPAGVSAQERALLEKLRTRRGEIDARDRDLELRDNLLRLSERKLDEKIGELRTLEGQMGKAGGKNDPKTRYKPLVVMYESMKPKDAARVFDRLDVGILLDLVDHMNPRKMSEILAAMDPATAEKLTVALAKKAAQGDAVVAENGQGQGGDPELQRLPVTPAR